MIQHEASLFKLILLFTSNHLTQFTIVYAQHEARTPAFGHCRSSQMSPFFFLQDHSFFFGKKPQQAGEKTTYVGPTGRCWGSGSWGTAPEVCPGG